MLTKEERSLEMRAAHLPRENIFAKSSTSALDTEQFHTSFSSVFVAHLIVIPEWQEICGNPILEIQLQSGYNLNHFFVESREFWQFPEINVLQRNGQIFVVPHYNLNLMLPFPFKFSLMMNPLFER